MTSAESPASHPELTGSAENLKGLKEGATHGKESWGTVLVKNADGKARSHITIKAKWDVPPDVPFSIFTYPNNSKLFRDVSEVGQRKVVSMQPGLKVVEVEQLQKIQVLWIHRTLTTWMEVTEDSRDADNPVVTFELLKSDVLSVFKGRWDLKSIKDESGAVVGCDAELNQDVLPKGIPKIMQHVPVMGELLRGISFRAIKRVMEDLNAAIEKIRVGMVAGRDHKDILRELCGVFEEQGHANGPVASHAVAFLDVSDDDPDTAQGSKAPPDPSKATSSPQPQSTPPGESAGAAAAAAQYVGPSQPAGPSSTAAAPTELKTTAAALASLTVGPGEESLLAAARGPQAQSAVQGSKETSSGDKPTGNL